MKEKFRKILSEKGIRQKTVIFTMLFFSAAVFISSVTFFLFIKDTKNKMMDKVLENLAEQKRAEIETYFDNLETLAYEIGYASWLQVLFEKNTMDIRTQQELSESVKYFLGSISQMNGELQFAVILNDGNRIGASTGNNLDYSVELKEKSWYSQFEKKGKYIETGYGKGLYTRGQGWYMTIYYPVNNKYSMEQEGVLAVTFREENLKRFGDIGTSGEYVSLEDENGEKIYSGLPEKVQEKLKKESTGYKTKKENIDIGGRTWILQAVLDTENIYIENTQMWVGFAAAMILAMFLFAAGAILFSEYLTKPILKCRDYMIKIRNNQMGVHMENHYHDELGELIDGFNEMSASISDLIERNKVISTLQKETEYQMLQQQINPHFLYNTLEIINGLIFSHKEKDAINVCENLGLMFRYSLNQSKWLKVKEEIGYIRQYLTIIRYKMPDLSVDWEIGEGVESRRILKAILQPIVENCIRHGFFQKYEECCISISIKEVKKGIEISITDNGRGMNREQYLVILKKLQYIRENPNEKREESIHIGIQNVFHRLFLEYGEAMKFQIITKELTGTRVVVYIPEGEEDA